RKHILFIIRELIDFQPESKGTDIAMALKYFTDALKKRTTSFLISDFIDEKDYYTAMSVASNKHDLIGIQIYDKRDTQIPNIGLLRVQDLETGKERWIDTSLAATRKALVKWWYERQQSMTETMRRCRVDSVSVATDEDYVKALMSLFRKRASR
ncbi:MAG: VWA domain-containing protein, partial [Paramuribaculum sp.]|nr:VWA domain-containing protein [Paramuribaculum sp.]